ERALAQVGRAVEHHTGLRLHGPAPLDRDVHLAGPGSRQRRGSGQRGRPRPQHRCPVTLPGCQRAGVDDVDTGLDASQVVTAQQPLHVVRLRTRLEQLPPPDHTVLPAQYLDQGGMVEVEACHRGTLARPSRPPLAQPGAAVDDGASARTCGQSRSLLRCAEVAAADTSAHHRRGRRLSEPCDTVRAWPLTSTASTTRSTTSSSRSRTSAPRRRSAARRSAGSSSTTAPSTPGCAPPPSRERRGRRTAPRPGGGGLARRPAGPPVLGRPGRHARGRDRGGWRGGRRPVRVPRRPPLPLPRHEWQRARRVGGALGDRAAAGGRRAQATLKWTIIIMSSCSRLWQCSTYWPRSPPLGASTSRASPGRRSTVSFQAGVPSGPSTWKPTRWAWMGWCTSVVSRQRSRVPRREVNTSPSWKVMPLTFHMPPPWWAPPVGPSAKCRSRVTATAPGSSRSIVDSRSGTRESSEAVRTTRNRIT